MVSNFLIGLGLERQGDDAGVLTRSVRQWWSRTTEVVKKIASRGWERDRESRTRVASVVANASREVESRV